MSLALLPAYAHGAAQWSRPVIRILIAAPLLTVVLTTLAACAIGILAPKVFR